MEDIIVGRLMSSPARTVTPDTPIQTAAQTMIEHDIGSVVVVDDTDRLRGILTSTDFVYLAAGETPTSETDVAAYMSTDVTTTTVHESIRDVADTMLDRGIHHVPVVDEDVVVGMITTADLAAYLSHVRTPSPA